MEDIQPLSFSEIRDIHAQLQDHPSFKGMNLQQFARHANDVTGTKLFSAGDSGAVGRAVKSASVGLDSLIEPVANVTGNVGESIGSMFGQGGADVGRSVGRALPRGTIDTLATLGGMALTRVMPAAGIPLTALGLALTGAKTYEETGSPVAGGLSAAATALMPAAGRVGTSLATRVARPVGSAIEKTLGGGLAGLVERGIEHGGGLAGVLGEQELANQGQSLASGHGLYNPLTPEHIGGTLGSVLPFEMFNLPGLARGYRGVVDSKGQAKAEPYNLTNMFSKEKPLARSLSDLERQQKGLQGVVKNAPEVVTPAAQAPASVVPTPEVTMNEPTITKPLNDIGSLTKGGAFDETGKFIPSPTTPVDFGASITSAENARKGLEPGIARGGAFDKAGKFVPSPTTDVTPTINQVKKTRKMLEDHFNKVDALTDNPTQALRATAELAKTPIVEGPSDKVDVNAAMAASQPPAGVEGEPAPTLLTTAKGFFDNLFRLRGYEPADVERLSNIGLRIAIQHLDTASRVKLFGISDTSTSYSFSDPRNPWIAISRSLGGVDKNLENALTFGAVGHELTHQTEASLIGKTPEQLNAAQMAYSKALKAASDMTPDERLSFSYLLHKMVLPVEGSTNEKLKRLINARSTANADKPNELLADVASFLSMGIASPGVKGPKNVSEVSDFLRFSEPQMAAFAKALYTDLSNSALAVSEFFRHSREGLGASPKVAKVAADNAFLVHDQAAKMIRAALANENAQRMIQSIANKQFPQVFMPDMTEGQVLQMVKDAGGVVSKQDRETSNSAIRNVARWLFGRRDMEKEGGVRPGMFDYLVPMAQFVKSHPEAKPAFDLAFSFRKISTDLAGKLLRPFMKDDLKLDEPFIKKMIEENTPVNNALNKVALLQNQLDRELTPEEFQKVAGGLGKENQEFLRDVLHRVGVSNVVAAKMRLDFYKLDIQNRIANIVTNARSSVPGLDSQLADQIAENVLSNALEGRPFNSQFSALPTPLKVKLLAFANSVKPTYDSMKEGLLGKDGQGKPWWFSEVRIGDWHVTGKKGDESYVNAFPSQDKAIERSKQLQKEGYKTKVWSKADRSESFKELSPDMIQRYAEADKDVFEAALKAMTDLTDSEREDLRQFYSPGEGALRLTTPPQLAQEGRLKGGREELNLMDGVLHYLDGTALGLAKRYVKGRASLVLHEPEIKNSPKLQNDLRGYLNDTINMPGREFNVLKNWIFMHYMGGNVASLMVEPTQTFLAHVPYLVREGASIGQAYKLATKGLLDAPEYAWGKGPKVVKDVLKHEAIIRAIHEGVIDKGFIQEVTSFEDANLARVRNAAQGGPLTGVKNLTSNSLYWLLQAGRNFYGLATKLNSTAAFMSAWDLAKSKGMNPDQAYSFAAQAVQTSMFGGGRAARPLVFSKLGEVQGFGSLAYTLQHYTFSMLSMIGRLGREMIDKQVPAAERTQARKAFGLMMGSQFVLGGAMGLPMAASVLALIDQFYPQAEVKKNLRESVAKLAGDDSQMGSLVADGVINGLTSALGPIDTGSRFQLGNVFGVNSYDGFSWGNLLGPGAGMLDKYVKGASAGASGDAHTFYRNLAPTSLRGLIDLHHNDFMERDKFGKLLFEPTTGEVISHVLGFQPKRLTDYYEQQRLLGQLESVQASQLERFHSDLAQKVLAGQASEVHADLIRKAQETPGYDVRNGARRIAELVSQMTTPADLYRSGSRTGAVGASNLASTYGQRPVTSEVARLVGKTKVEQSLGVPGTGSVSPVSLRLAQMVDMMVAQNPSLTPTEARSIVYSKFHPQQGVAGVSPQ